MIAGRYLNGRPSGRGCRNSTLVSLSILALAAGAAISSAATPEPAEPQADPVEVQTVAAKDAPNAFAVIELFTSESCPSRPAADRLLSEMGAEARKHGQRLMPLAFHVDYWNTGSAADPFSDTGFARRQRSYAAVLDPQEEVYTPQMIVNGRVGFVGSERAKAERQIKAAALGRPATATVKVAIENASQSAGTIRVNCDVRTAATNTNLQLAVVERNLSTSGKQGDRGKALDNVVRVFKSVPLSKGSYQTVELQLPKDLVRKNASVVGYVQDGRSLAILGATSVDLASAALPRVASSE